VQDGPFVATLRAQWLGDQLRRLRQARGMTLKYVAGQVDRPAAVLDRYERAEWPWRYADVTALLDLYGLHTPTVRERLQAAAESVWRRHHWEHDKPDQDGWHITHNWLTGRATRVCLFLAVLPGAEFATASPVPVEVIAAEHGLWQRHRGQMITSPHLPALAELTRLPEVKVRILPAAAAPGLEAGGGFIIYRMPAPYPPVAHVDGLAGSFYLEEPIVAGYTDAYQRLTDLALGVRDSTELITTMIVDGSSRRG
jgi:Domain of unknown function (DUF5753)/Helix-turn-helix domain